MAMFNSYVKLTEGIEIPPQVRHFSDCFRWFDQENWGSKNHPVHVGNPGCHKLSMTWDGKHSTRKNCHLGLVYGRFISRALLAFSCWTLRDDRNPIPTEGFITDLGCFFKGLFQAVLVKPDIFCWGKGITRIRPMRRIWSVGSVGIRQCGSQLGWQQW